MLSGFLFVLLAAASYAFFPIFSKIAFEADLEALDLISWRFSIATIAIWLSWFLRTRQLILPPLKRRQILSLLCLGALFTGVALVAFMALERIPASTYTLIIYTYPAMVGVMGWFMGDTLTNKTWLAIGATLLGCVLTAGGQFTLGQPLDIIFPLANAFLYAVYLILVGRYTRQIDGFSSAFYSITGSLLVLIPVMLWRGIYLPTDLKAWIAILGIGVIATVVPIMAMFEGIARIGAANASVLSTIEPVFTILLAIVLLHEKIVLLQLVGGALIIFSVIQLALSQRRAETVA